MSPDGPTRAYASPSRGLQHADAVLGVQLSSHDDTVMLLSLRGGVHSILARPAALPIPHHKGDSFFVFPSAAAAG